MRLDWLRGAVTSTLRLHRSDPLPILLDWLRDAPLEPDPSRLLREDLERLVVQAREHRLSALVGHLLSQRGFALPEALGARLAQDAHAVVGAGLRVKGLLFKSLGALAAAGVVPVPLKGYALAARYWPEPLLRPMSDVDLLVAPVELPKAISALQELSLRPARGEHPHHVALHGPLGSVELHFRPWTGFGTALDHGSIAQRLIPAALEQHRVLLLDPADELVYLTLHATQHLFQRVGWLYDLARLMDKEPALDWDRVVWLSREIEAGPASYAGLEALQAALGAVVPENVLRALKPPKWQRVLAERLFHPSVLVDGSLARSKELSFGVRTLLAGSAPCAVRHSAQGGLRLWRSRPGRQT